MATTSVDLGEHFTSFLSQLKESGRYRNVSEAVRAGLRLLEQEESENRAKIERIRQEIINGEESGQSNRSVDTIWQEVKTRIDDK